MQQVSPYALYTFMYKTTWSYNNFNKATVKRMETAH